MPYSRGLLFVLLALAAAVLAFALLSPLAVGPATAAAGNRLALATPAPTLSAPIEFSATVSVVPAVTYLAVGELLRVTTNVVVDPESVCGYATLEMKLRQSGDSGALFEYVSPPDERIGPPGAGSSAYILRALQPGTVVFDAEAYGEKYCGFWQWWYVYGHSAPVHVFVAGDGREAHLPIVTAP